jgi:xanthine dehydrogenase large subunit
LWWPTAIWPRAAARLGKISYAERPAILTVDDAMAANSRFEGGPVIWTRAMRRQRLRRRRMSVEGQMEVGGQEHFYLEGQVAWRAAARAAI